MLTSGGEVREVIQELHSGNTDSDVEDDEDDEDDSGSSDNNSADSYPSFKKIVDALETFYGTKEDQNVLLRELRALRIKRFEKVKDFNLRYKILYLKLDKKRKTQVNVLD